MESGLCGDDKAAQSTLRKKKTYQTAHRTVFPMGLSGDTNA